MNWLPVQGVSHIVNKVSLQSYACLSARGIIKAPKIKDSLLTVRESPKAAMTLMSAAFTFSTATETH